MFEPLGQVVQSEWQKETQETRKKEERIEFIQFHTIEMKERTENSRIRIRSNFYQISHRPIFDYLVRIGHIKEIKVIVLNGWQISPIGRGSRQISILFMPKLWNFISKGTEN